MVTSGSLWVTSRKTWVTSFIGFLPANNPKYVIYIAIDNAKGVTQYVWTIAAPIAKRILEDIIEIKKLPKEEEGIPKTYNYYDIKYAKVPNVYNMPLNEAIKLLKDFKVEISGEGNRIIYQSPVSDTNLPIGDKIRVMLGN